MDRMRTMREVLELIRNDSGDAIPFRLLKSLSKHKVSVFYDPCTTHSLAHSLAMWERAPRTC